MSQPTCSLPTHLLACLIGALLAFAEPVQAETSELAQESIKDAGLYFTAPLRWDRGDWSYFGTTIAAVAAAHEFDGKVRDHFAPAGGVVLDGYDRHSTRDALPAAALVVGTLAYAAAMEDRSGYGEGWSMLEAAALSSVTSYALKFAAGRERPNESVSVDNWRSSGDSFPSLHATAAFAIGTVFAESGNDQYRWLRRGIGYGVAAGTAYRRLDANVHWLSDTVAGAAIGLATASFVLNRNVQRRFAGRLDVMPLEGGLLLTWSAPLQ